MCWDKIKYPGTEFVSCKSSNEDTATNALRCWRAETFTNVIDLRRLFLEKLA